MSVMVGKPLLSFVDAATKMSVADFAKEHGSAFFILVTNHPSRAEHRGKTEWNPVSAKQAAVSGEEKTGDTGVYVLPLVKKPANQSGILRVGRGDSCDIVVVDVTISKLHAFVIENRGQFELFDAGSRNGTFVGDTEVAARGTGAATVLTPRAKVRFGSVSMTFLDAEQLHGAAKARAR